MSSLMSFCPSCAFCLAVGAIVALILSRNAFLMANIKEKINGIKHKIMNGDRYDKIKRQARQNPWFGKENPVCIVTGSNSGMGYEAALNLAMAGCHVILAVRNQQKGNDAAVKIKTSTGNHNIEVMVLDMSSVESTKTFANEFISKKLPLHVLIHNAGASSNGVKFNSHSGLEENMSLNFINVVLLTSLLLPIMRKTSPAARIILVGSSAHFTGKRDISLCLADCKVPISGWELYASSKLNLIAYGHALGEVLDQTHDTVSVCSLDPGFVATPFYTKELPFPINIFGKLSNAAAKSPALGAHTQLYAALVDVPVPNGAYLQDTLIATSSVIARDKSFQQMLMKNTVSKLKEVAPWWDGKWC